MTTLNSGVTAAQVHRASELRLYARARVAPSWQLHEGEDRRNVPAPEVSRG